MGIKHYSHAGKHELGKMSNGNLARKDTSHEKRKTLDISSSHLSKVVESKTI